MSKMFKRGDFVKTSLTVLGSLLLTAGVVGAATTISTNISTGGTLTVIGATAGYGAATFGATGTTTLAANGTVTLGGVLTSYSAGNFGSATIGATASTSISAAGVLSFPTASSTGLVKLNSLQLTNGATIGTVEAGALTIGGNATSLVLSPATSLSSTLGVTGLATLANSSTTGNTSLAGALWVGGNATTTAAGAISTQSSLTVAGDSSFVTASSTSLVKANSLKIGPGSTNTSLTGLIFGTCTLPSITLTASTTVYTDCTASGKDLTGYSVVMQGAGKVSTFNGLPDGVFISSASTTAATVIGIGVYNTGINGSQSFTAGTSILGYIAVK